MSRSCFVAAIALSVVLAGCGETESAPDSQVRIEPASCDLELDGAPPPAGLECAIVTVPEDRQVSDGRTVRLAVAVLRATDPDPLDDPIIYLQGGPGGESVDGIVSLLGPLFIDPLQSQRDLVFLDQRGTGRSLPSLQCPEFIDAFAAGFAVPDTAQQDVARLVGALRACRDRLLREGVNLSAYNSAASAVDVRDVMTALGYRRWNLYGLSYGTRLALTAMRDAPQGIRSVILDSTLPIQVDFPAAIARNFERSLDAVFDLCERDPACHQAFPDLASVFYDLVARLDEAPVTLEPTDPMTGEPLRLVLTGSRFAFGVYQALYRPELISLLPLAIRELAAGNGTLVGTAAALLLGRLRAVAWGMQISVFCAEEVPFVTADVLRDANSGVRPEALRAGAYVTDLSLETCGFWGFQLPSPIEDAAVTSDIPTLVLAGALDPITPPDDGRLAAETLTQSQFFEFPGFGHGVIVPNPAEHAVPRCAMQMVHAFLDNPAVAADTSCIADLPALRFAGS